MSWWDDNGFHGTPGSPVPGQPGFHYNEAGGQEPDGPGDSSSAGSTSTAPAGPYTGPQSQDTFDGAAYLKANPDVARAIAQGQFGGNPYNHWVQYGQKEGRAFTPKSATTSNTTTPTSTDNSAWQSTEFGSYNGGAPDAKVQQMIADYIKSQGLTASQSDPASLKKIVDYLRTQGINNVSVAKTDQNGHTGGLNIGGNEYQLINGSNQWTPLQSWQGGNASAGSGSNTGSFGSMGSTGPQTLPSGLQTGIGNFDGWSGEFSAPQGNEAPDYQQLSPWSLNNLGSADQFTYNPLATPAPFTYDPLKTPDGFVGPTDVTEKNDPGYQFRLKQGLGAIENSAAAKGALHNPNVLQGLNNYAQDYSSNEFQNVWNRDFNAWNANTQASAATQAQQYAQALNAAQFNTGTAAQAQAQQYSQGLSAAQYNEQNRQGIYGVNNNNAIALRADATNQNNQWNNSRINNYTTNYQNARDRYLMAYDAFRNNQNDNFSRNYQLASLGAGTT